MVSVTQDLSTGSEWNLTADWIGAAVDPGRRELVIGAPGGHGGWPGNEVYVWRAAEDPPRWVRTRTGSTGSAQDVENGPGTYADGQPSSTHSYHRPVCARGHFWLPGLDSVQSASGWWTTATFSYDLAQESGGVWRSHGRLLTTGTINKWLGGSSAYDPVTDKIYATPQYGAENRWVTIDVAPRLAGADIAYPGAAPNTTIYSSFPGNAGYNVMVAAADLRLLILLCGDAGAYRLYTLDLDNPGGGFTARAMSGAPVDPYGGGLVYHQPSRALIGWYNSGLTLRRLAIPSSLQGPWAWSSVTTTGSPPPNANQGVSNANQQAFGRFNIIPDMGNGEACLVYYPIYDQVGMYVCRLVGPM